MSEMWARVFRAQSVANEDARENALGRRLPNRSQSEPLNRLISSPKSVRPLLMGGGRLFRRSLVLSVTVLARPSSFLHHPLDSSGFALACATSTTRGKA